MKLFVYALTLVLSIGFTTSTHAAVPIGSTADEEVKYQALQSFDKQFIKLNQDYLNQGYHTEEQIKNYLQKLDRIVKARNLLLKQLSISHSPWTLK